MCPQSTPEPSGFLLSPPGDERGLERPWLYENIFVEIISGYVASVMTFRRGDILKRDFKGDFGI